MDTTYRPPARARGANEAFLDAQFHQAKQQCFFLGIRIHIFSKKCGYVIEEKRCSEQKMWIRDFKNVDTEFKSVIFSKEISVLVTQNTKIFRLRRADSDNTAIFVYSCSLSEKNAAR